MAPSMKLFGSVPVTEQAHSVASYQALLHTLGRLDDAKAGEPSLLADWTRGHVVTHLARHAESQVRMLEGLQRGELIPQYAGGASSRRTEIERGAARPAAELVDDFRRTSEALFACWEAFPADLWSAEVNTIMGRRAARDTVWSRWFEQELHHVDLDLGFAIGQWPAAFVTTALGHVLTSLGARLRDDAPSGSWVLQTSDSGLSWTVTVADGAASARTGADGPADVAGDAAVVLAWLVGRVAVDDDRLTVADGAGPDPRLLPTWFPHA